MSRKSMLLASLVAVFCALPLMAQRGAQTTLNQARTSPHDTINAIIDGSYNSNTQRMIIVYGRPFSKAPRGTDIRKIWGTLVPWDKVWRMGADEASMMIVTEPVMFGDVTVPAGACSVYMLPSENGTSKLIFNKKIGQWGINGQGIAYPDDMKDTEIGRVDLKKDTVNPQVDQFTIAITPKQGGGGGTLKLTWETTQYSVDFMAKK